MTLKAECASPSEALRERTRRDAARGDKARRQCRTGRAGSLPNDGKVIADERKPLCQGTVCQPPPFGPFLRQWVCHACQYPCFGCLGACHKRGTDPVKVVALLSLAQFAQILFY